MEKWKVPMRAFEKPQNVLIENLKIFNLIPQTKNFILFEELN